MATVNLGSIKFNWKGTYAGATAYTIDDVVSYNGSSYICIQASTGNLPTDTAYFEQMSSAGTNGTDGTDVGTTITTQGDILYRDGSGLQRLGAGTSGQVLQTGGTGANPSWGTVSSDMVLLHTTSTMSGATVAVDNVFSSTYTNYRIIISNYYPASNSAGEFRFRNGGSALTAADYTYTHTRQERSSSTVSQDSVANAWGNTLAEWFQTAYSGNSDYTVQATIDIFNPSIAKPIWWRTASVGWDTGANWLINVTGGGTYRVSTACDGIQFSTSSGNISGGILKIYGFK